MAFLVPMSYRLRLFVTRGRQCFRLNLRSTSLMNSLGRFQEEPVDIVQPTAWIKAFTSLFPSLLTVCICRYDCVAFSIWNKYDRVFFSENRLWALFTLLFSYSVLTMHPSTWVTWSFGWGICTVSWCGNWVQTTWWVCAMGNQSCQGTFSFLRVPADDGAYE